MPLSYGKVVVSVLISWTFGCSFSVLSIFQRPNNDLIVLLMTEQRQATHDVFV